MPEPSRGTIIISGFAGTGSTTVSQLVANHFGLEYVYAGGIFRKMAADAGMGIDDFHISLKDDPDGERRIDDRLLARARQGKVVVESRTLPWLLTDFPAYKAWLTCEPRERARRIGEGRGALEEARRAEERITVEQDRYRSLYGFDMTDLSVFDRVIDTTAIPATEVARQIIADLES